VAIKGKQRGAVFRKPPLTAFCMAGDIFFIAGFAYVASVVPQPGLFFVALILTGLTYLFWLIGWHSAIRLDESGVIVDNGLMRHEISWNGLSGIMIGYGLTFGLRSGGEVRSVMFGGSVMGAVIDYKYTEKIAERMRQYRTIRFSLMAQTGRHSVAIGCDGRHCWQF
jgi:hypothetical protein